MNTESQLSDADFITSKIYDVIDTIEGADDLHDYAQLVSDMFDDVQDVVFTADKLFEHTDTVVSGLFTTVKTAFERFSDNNDPLDWLADIAAFCNDALSFCADHADDLQDISELVVALGCLSNSLSRVVLDDVVEDISDIIETVADAFYEAIDGDGENDGISGFIDTLTDELWSDDEITEVAVDV